MTRSAAELLRQARHAAGLSQRELSRRTGVASTLLSAYENSRRQPGADTLLRLLAATGSSLTVRSTITDSRSCAAQLEQVCALAMALPRRDPGPLAFPPFRTLVRAV